MKECGYGQSIRIVVNLLRVVVRPVSGPVPHIPFVKGNAWSLCGRGDDTKFVVSSGMNTEGGVHGLVYGYIQTGAPGIEDSAVDAPPAQLKELTEERSFNLTRRRQLWENVDVVSRSRT